MAAQFIVWLRPARAGFTPDTATEAEIAKVAEHFRYMQGALADGRLVMAGRTQEAPFVGLAIIDVEDREEAQAFADADPAVAARVFIAEVQSYAVALARESRMGNGDR